MQLPSRLAVLFVLASVGGTAYAQDVIATVTNPWKGFYAGVNIGGAWNSTCNSWTPNGGNGITNPAVATAFYNRDCPNNGVFVGGVQIGYNFQYNQLVWGFGLDYDGWSAKTRNRSLNYTGPNPPPNGIYAFSGKVSPNGFGIIGPRIAYAFDNFLPFVRIGSVFTGGSSKSTATFTDASGTATFNGGRNFKSSGFGFGTGFDYMVVDQVFFRLEFTHISLGKGSNSVTTCTGSAVTCANFGTVELNNIHNSFTANILRVGINYKF